MPIGSIILAAVLIALGGIVGLVCWIALLVRAFRVSVLWGLGTFFFPIIGLVFMVLYWEENKKLFIVYLGSGALVFTAGYFLVPSPVWTELLNHGHGPVASAKTQRGIALPAPVMSASASATAKPQPAASATASGPGPVSPAVAEIDKAIKQKRMELVELYDSLDTWAKRLLAKRSQLNKDNPADVRAFNDEYAGYQAALKDYKNQSSQVEHLEADRLEALKKTGQMAQEPAKKESKQP